MTFTKKRQLEEVEDEDIAGPSQVKKRTPKKKKMPKKKKTPKKKKKMTPAKKKKKKAAALETSVVHSLKDFLNNMEA